MRTKTKKLKRGRGGGGGCVPRECWASRKRPRPAPAKPDEEVDVAPAAPETRPVPFYLDDTPDPRGPRTAARVAELARYVVGVYVDVSCRKHCLYLGFFVRGTGYTRCLSTTSLCGPAQTSQAEREAVWMARRLWPNMPVFCDHAEACHDGNAIYINRVGNRRAHNVARSRANFVPRSELGCDDWAG